LHAKQLADIAKQHFTGAHFGHGQSFAHFALPLQMSEAAGHFGLTGLLHASSVGSAVALHSPPSAWQYSITEAHISPSLQVLHTSPHFLFAHTVVGAKHVGQGQCVMQVALPAQMAAAVGHTGAGHFSGIHVQSLARSIWRSVPGHKRVSSVQTVGGFAHFGHGQPSLHVAVPLQMSEAAGHTGSFLHSLLHLLDSGSPQYFSVQLSWSLMLARVQTLHPSKKSQHPLAVGLSLHV